MSLSVTVEEVKATSKGQEIPEVREVAMPTGSARKWLGDFLEALDNDSIPTKLPWRNALELLKDARAAARIRIQAELRAKAEGRVAGAAKDLSE